MVVPSSWFELAVLVMMLCTIKSFEDRKSGEVIKTRREERDEVGGRGDEKSF